MPVSCSRQYDTWRHGQGKGLIADLDAVGSAVTARDTHALTAALKKARRAVVRAARHPMPACADPRGYWSVLIKLFGFLDYRWRPIRASLSVRGS